MTVYVSNVENSAGSVYINQRQNKEERDHRETPLSTAMSVKKVAKNQFYRAKGMTNYRTKEKNALANLMKLVMMTAASNSKIWPVTSVSNVRQSAINAESISATPAKSASAISIKT